MKKKAPLILLIFTALTISNSFAQESTNSQGGVIEGSGGSLSFTVGQPFQKIDGTIEEGIQQPYEVFLVTATENKAETEVSVYPNPTTEFLIVKSNSANSSYQLTNLSGELLEEGKLTQGSLQIQMKKYEPAVYFLQLQQSDQAHKTYKIIKH